jgi:hypothetical protein
VASTVYASPVLGVPSGFGVTGAACLLCGLLIAAIAAWRRRASIPSDLTGRAATVCLVLTMAAVPYFAWRIVEDLRVTTAMTSYDLSVAGPVQAYLQPYLLDPVARIIPPNATYATVEGPGVPYAGARDAFASLAMITLFPRKAVADPRQADWVIAWGAKLRGVVPVSGLTVARPAQAGYPAVLVGRVRR